MGQLCHSYGTLRALWNRTVLLARLLPDTSERALP